MHDILYASTIRDPKSKTAKESDNFLVCKKINNKWHIFEGHYGGKRAMEAMNIMANQDLVNGHITDIHVYRVFKKNQCEIKYFL